MSCKYNNCKHCGYKSECEIFKENAELKKKNLDTQDATTISDAPLTAEENEMLEQGYVWDYMTQAKITTKIITKEKGVTMFEKEAEEWVENNLHSTEEDYIKAFKDGAEFGYNKANEWHYPSKGEYPKDEKNVLCILGEFENINLEVGYYSQRENERERWRFSEYSTPDDSEDYWGVSAWKEIVLPELSKESE